MVLSRRMIDRRIAATALAIVTFCSGWAARALLFRESELPPPEQAASVLEPPPAAPASTSSTSTQQVFEDIYRRAKWGTNAEDAGTSGYGSSLPATLVYRAFLQQFMENAGVRSVVDAGCGDWESSQAIDWKGIDYKGYDIVASVVDGDKKKYGKTSIQFFVANVVEEDLPPADLLICKHVLQHLPTADVQKFLKQLPKYKHVLLVDSVNPGTLSGKNQDVSAGAFRELDVTRPPLSVRGAKVLTYWDGGNMQQVVYVPHPS